MDINHYRRLLPVRKNRLDEDLEIQSQYMDEIAQQVTAANSRMLRLKDELAREEAALSKEMREDYPKLTVGQVAEHVIKAPRRIQAWREYADARTEHETWSHLLDAWKQKGYSIRVMADLHAAQYFSPTSVSGGSVFTDRLVDTRARESVTTTIQARRTARKSLNHD